MRKMTAPELLSGLEAVTGLHYNREVLHDKEEELVRLTTHKLLLTSYYFTTH